MAYRSTNRTLQASNCRIFDWRGDTEEASKYAILCNFENYRLIFEQFAEHVHVLHTNLLAEDSVCHTVPWCDSFLSLV